MNEKELDVVFILDKSGSMRGTESDTVGGYNSYIESFKDKNAKITTVLFNWHYEMITRRKNVSDVKELTTKKYRVGGGTALLDAIGKSIRFMEKQKAKKVIFIITTDGEENSSTRYSKTDIKELIKKHDNWEFIYIGANIDSYAEGQSIGIKRDNIANYSKDRQGISTMFKAMCAATEDFYEDNEINTSWKKDLDTFIDENIFD